VARIVPNLSGCSFIANSIGVAELRSPWQLITELFFASVVDQREFLQASACCKKKQLADNAENKTKMTKNETQKLNLADGYAFGTFQTWTKDIGKKSGSPYVRVGILIGKTVHDFFDTVPKGSKIDDIKRPDWPVGQIMLISQPDFAVSSGGRIQASCRKLEPITDK
jgi:hypothetical protein